MISKEAFVADIAAEAAKQTGDSVVFIVEMGNGVDEDLVHQVEQVLADLVGDDRLKSFRVR